ncbi:MAG: hypothetical protein KDJ41_17755 [Hyphomicrobiaceae bacterium]|nr:hypothetical protein [Hyphomicrobiaceae bacterium]
MKHALGLLGVLAAGVLLAVSAAMNWRFGLQLGKTEFDGQIYGAASAAADCLKALVPFFLFASIRNKMWSQAAASALVWVVCTAYSLTSALGHAALNRQDTTGARAVQAAVYKDMRAELKRSEEKLAWIPQHRPAMTVQAGMDSLKTERAWAWSKGCTEVKGKSTRELCQKYHGLAAELAAADQARKLDQRIRELRTQLATGTTGTAVASADPQAAVLAKIAGLVFPTVRVEDVQMALTVFIALLLEIGSSFGMYVAFSQWRIYDHRAEAVPAVVPNVTVATAVQPPVTVAPPIAAPPVVPAKPKVTANDNRSQLKLVAPESDVERFHKDRIQTAENSSLTAMALYEDYCAWCEEQNKEPLALPTFGRQFGELGVEKAKVAGRIRYMGIKLNSGLDYDEEDKTPARSVA